MEIYSFLQNGKEVKKSQESYLCKGRFPYECVLLRFGNTLGLGCPSLRRTHSYGNLPYKL
jgi:hypothetical protein